jgi:hypothetical protein
MMPDSTWTWLTRPSWRRLGGIWRSGVSVDRGVTNTNAAACLVIRYAPLHEVQAMFPDLVTIVDEQLPAGDLERVS